MYFLFERGRKVAAGQDFHRLRGMRARYIPLALLLALAPLPSLAQGGPPGPGERRAGGRHGPVEKLIGNREALGLSDDQIARLQEIDDRLRERNRPFVQKLIEMRRGSHFDPRVKRGEMTPDQRAEFDRRIDEVRPLLSRIHENNVAAMREVGGVLTAEQKERIRSLLEEGKRRHERDRSAPQRGWRGD